MVSSAEDAALLIQGFQASENEVVALFHRRDNTLSFSLIATEVRIAGDWRVELKAPGLGRFEMDLRGCRFDYGDVREAPEALREALERVEGLLVITLPSGDYMGLAEARPLPCPTEHEP